MTLPLPPGQREIECFPRFGLIKFANRFPRNVPSLRFNISGAVATPSTIHSLDELPRVEQTSDFHCVTTWSVRNLCWSGFRFADFHYHIATPTRDAKLVIFHGSDGYCSILPLADLLAADVLLADRLGGEPLSISHGAPLRLVAPAHYGYKNVKHLSAIEYSVNGESYRFPRPYPRLMDHPRARVALEERADGVPAWLLKPIYRLLIPTIIRSFERAMRTRDRS